MSNTAQMGPYGTEQIEGVHSGFVELILIGPKALLALRNVDRPCLFAGEVIT